MVERNEVSRQEVEVFRVLLANSTAWKTNTELAEACQGVATRTVRAMTFKFVRLGIVDQADVFPAHKYRLAAKADKRNRGYIDRLRQAASVFDVVLTP